MCVQAYGVQHSLESSATPGASPGPGTSPEDAERALSRWRRTAPSQKGVLRHAYIEKSWTHNGWEDVGAYLYHFLVPSARTLLLRVPWSACATAAERSGRAGERA